MKHRDVLAILLSLSLLIGCAKPTTTPPSTPSIGNNIPMPLTPAATSEAEDQHESRAEEASNLQGPYTGRIIPPSRQPVPGILPPTQPPSTPIPTRIPTLPVLDVNAEVGYLQDGGAVPEHALGRIGIGNIWDIDILSNQQMLLQTASGLYMYETTTFERVWRRYLNRQPWGVQTSPDGRRITVDFGWESSPLLYDSATGDRIATLNGWHAAHWSPHSTLIAVEQKPPFEDETQVEVPTGQIALYDAETGEYRRMLEAPLEGFWGAVYSHMIWSPDGALLMACGDQSLNVWDVVTTELRSTADVDASTGGLYLRNCGAEFSPDGQYIAYQDNNRFYAGSYLVENSHHLELEANVKQVIWLPKRIGVVINDSLHLYGTTYWSEIKSIPLDDGYPILSPNHTELAIISPSKIRIIDLDTFEERLSIPTASEYAFYSTNGRWLVTGVSSNPDRDETWQYTYTLFDAAIGQQVFEPFTVTHGITFIDDEHLLVANMDRVLMFELPLGTLIGSSLVNLHPILLKWAENSQALTVSTQEGKTWVWRELDGQLIEGLGSAGVGPSIEIPDYDWRTGEVSLLSPDGSLKAVGLNDTACGDGPWGGGCGVWGGSLSMYEGDTLLYELGRTNDEWAYSMYGISSLAWSSDGQYLAVGSAYAEGSIEGHAILILDAHTGETLMTLEGHLSAVSALIFSPDGYRLASYSEDGTIIIWNVSR